MKNPPNKKERGLVKGALRRVFSRSELRKKALDKALIKDYHDPSRKRVTRWGKCSECKLLIPLYLMEIDHKEPLIPTGETLEEQSWDKIIDRLWCNENNLQALCQPCHKLKTSAEGVERRRLKKEKAKK